MKRLLMLAAAAAALGLTPAGAFAQAQSPTHAALSAAIAADYQANLGDLWDHFHRNPELSGMEVETSARMAEEFRALGYEVTTGVGGHGVVGVLRNGDGPTVMLRADMDGLPLAERSGLPNASTVMQVDAHGVRQPVMHACGHDVHITALVGAARQLMARRDQWSGTLVLVAQPAEETISGARAMIEDGLYERFPKPDYAIGVHVGAGALAGQIVVADTITSSSSDSVDIAVHGVGAHGASPHRGVDPVLIASQIVVSLQTLRSREIDPLQGAVVTVGAINGGVKHNIIPEQVNLQLTVRADSPEIRTRLLDGIDRIAMNTARALGVAEDALPTVTRSPTETTPATINDTATAVRVRQALTTALGPDRLTPSSRSGMGAEDFAYFVTPESGVKGVYIRVGGTPADEMATAPSHHSPLFRITPQPSVIAGVEAYVIGAEALMAR